MVAAGLGCRVDVSLACCGKACHRPRHVLCVRSHHVELAVQGCATAAAPVAAAVAVDAAYIPPPPAAAAIAAPQAVAVAAADDGDDGLAAVLPMMIL